MIRPELFAKYDVPVPRYTSYPTVPQWRDAPTRERMASASLATPPTEPDASLAVYVHIPFCESLCTFCGCNTVITRDHRREAIVRRPRACRARRCICARVPALGTRPAAAVASRRRHADVPLAAQALGRLVDGLFARLPQQAEGVRGLGGSRSRGSRPPRNSRRCADADSAHLARRAGRRSGRAAARESASSRSRQTAALVPRHARGSATTSINFDLIYGLPGQTPATMERPSSRRCSISRPIGWRSTALRGCRGSSRPSGGSATTRFRPARRSARCTSRARAAARRPATSRSGWTTSRGPADALARAAAAGRLHRNFMGYTDVRTSVLLGLGVSAISETAGLLPPEREGAHGLRTPRPRRRNPDAARPPALG